MAGARRTTGTKFPSSDHYIHISALHKNLLTLTLTPRGLARCASIELSSRREKRRGDPGPRWPSDVPLDRVAVARSEGRASFDSLWLAVTIRFDPPVDPSSS